MDDLRDILDVLFRRVPAVKVLDSICGYFDGGRGLRSGISFDNFDKGELVKAAAAYMGTFYSPDEITNLASFFAEDGETYRRVGYGSRGRGRLDVFRLAASFANTVLVRYDSKLFCEYKHLLRWRALSHLLGEDIFTMAFWADKDVSGGLVWSASRGMPQDRTRTERFLAPPLVKINNIRLKNLLNNGVVDNHFHLRGSASHFELSWLNLMNNIFNEAYMVNNGIKKAIKEFEDSPLAVSLGYDSTPSNSLYLLLMKAAAIRWYLHCFVRGAEIIYTKESHRGYDHEKHAEEYGQLAESMDNRAERALLLNLLKINDEGDQLLPDMRFEYLWRIGDETDMNAIEKHHGSIDYALTKRDFSRDDDVNQGLGGERRLLYGMLAYLFSSEHMCSEDRYIKGNLFYAYLLIKNKLRSELIQVNEVVGFANFYNYQDRKDKLINGNPLYDKSLYRMAIKDTPANQSLKALEARIGPAKTAEHMARQIRYIDDVVSGYNDSDRYLNKFFYVLSVAKKNDITNFNKGLENYEATEREVIKEFTYNAIARHESQRRWLKAWALNLAGLRDKYSEELRFEGQFVSGKSTPEVNYPNTQRRYMSSQVSRIYGIDACSNEIHCRPEVFAVAFRFLAEHSASGLPNLRITYHVGEDFLDVIDGLRAVEEAVRFMNMGHGSRLGHALVLGINVREWYEKKRRSVKLSKQELLDNLAWMHAKIRKFNIPNSEGFILQIEKQFNHYFRDVYLNNIKQQEQTAVYNSALEFEKLNDINEYYNAWKMRGDDPSLCLEPGEPLCDPLWDSFRKNGRHYSSDYLWKNDIARFLYKQYHYNYRVKRDGFVQVNYDVDDMHIAVATQIQRHIYNWVVRRYIGIESNPSSNYLIGTFKRYDKHPVFKWLPPLPTSGTQAFVSVNTDDQGVFNTCIENEYALLALAMEKACDHNGKHLYNHTPIYEWLDKIRRMGIEQCFKKI